MLNKILGGGVKGLTGISAAFLAVSVVLSTFNAVARSFFSSSYPWIEELCCYLAALMMFLMMPCLEFNDEQLSISFLDEKFKNNRIARQILFYIRGVVTVVFNGVLIRAGYKVVARNLQIGSASPVLKLPYGRLYTLVMAALILLIVYWIFHFFINEWRGRPNERS